MFLKGQRVRIIDPGSSFHGVVGVVTRIEEHKCWAIWKDDNYETWMPITEVELASRFRIGDTIQVGKRIIAVDGIVKFNEKRAVLIERKCLI